VCRYPLRALSFTTRILQIEAAPCPFCEKTFVSGDPSSYAIEYPIDILSRKIIVSLIDRLPSFRKPSRSNSSDSWQARRNFLFGLACGNRCPWRDKPFPRIGTLLHYSTVIQLRSAEGVQVPKRTDYAELR
jgi:hypothetical protein